MQEVEQSFICGRCGEKIPFEKAFDYNHQKRIFCSKCNKQYGIPYKPPIFCSLCHSPQYVYSFTRTDHSNFFCSNPDCPSYRFTVAKDRRSCRLSHGKVQIFRLELRGVSKPLLYFRNSHIFNCYASNWVNPHNALRDLFFQSLERHNWRVLEDADGQFWLVQP